jgi:hypothetical protein
VHCDGSGVLAEYIREYRLMRRDMHQRMIGPTPLSSQYHKLSLTSLEGFQYE